jgi:signal transduction histidine kinase
MNEIEALKEELKQTKLAYWMATQIGQFKSGFLARTAHELRSPLSSLMGLHQIILSDLCENPQEEREFLAQSYEAAQKLIKLLDELIAVSKIEYGSIELEILPTPLTSVLSELQQFTTLQAKNRRLTLEVDFPTSELYLMVDRQYLLKILINLVDAAIGSLKEGKIRVSGFFKGDRPQGCINIDCPLNIWSEPVDLLQLSSQSPTFLKPSSEEIKSFSQQVKLSPGMKFTIAQSLMETMGGHLDVLEMSLNADTETITRLQCWLPVVPAEVAVREFLED